MHLVNAEVPPPAADGGKEETERPAIWGVPALFEVAGQTAVAEIRCIGVFL
jgi:hypothetical protein